jgi:LacI family transcriptional regulator
MLLLGVYHPQHHQGIARYAREAGWIVDQGHVDGTDEAPVWWRGDGMITLITRPKHYAAFRLMPKVPMVDLSRGWVSNAMPPRLRATGRGRPRVLEDNTAIGRLAAEHFLERGFEHIAFFNFGNWWLETERIPAFRRTVETAGAQYIELPYYRHVARQPTNTVVQERRAHRWLVDAIRGLPKPAGIFAPTDDLALSVLRACGDAGVGTPEEVAVLGCDNSPLVCDFAPVPLSSVDPDLEGQGYEAARLLGRLMDGEPPPKGPILIPPRGVVTRQSTNILAVPHVPTARALRFIWEHYRERIRTPEIAAAAGLSRRGVEHSFRQHLRRSIAEEVSRCRVEHARDLLLTTGMKAWQVAEAAGFSGIVDFSRVFKRVVGLAPHHYRRQHLAGGARPPRPSAARPAPDVGWRIRTLDGAA